MFYSLKKIPCGGEGEVIERLLALEHKPKPMTMQEKCKALNLAREWPAKIDECVSPQLSKYKVS
jgi:hypothetical protein